MIAEKWHYRFMDMASVVSSWSKDPSTKVGAVITRGKKIVSLGYNGFPAGVDDKNLSDREYKYPRIVHAELNAILQASGDLTGASIYVYPLPPCPDCMGAIIQSGIKFIYTTPLDDEATIDRWATMMDVASSMARDAGIKMRYLNKQKLNNFKG